MTLWSDVEALFASRPEPPMRAVPGHTMYGPADDDSGPEKGEPVEADLDGVAIEIVYRDSRGEPSVRTIRCHRLREEGGYYYVDAECALRQAYRTFRLDRIVEIRDYSTGEVIDDIPGFFAPYLGEDIALRARDQSPAPARLDPARPDRASPSRSTSDNPRIAGAFRDGARVLLYLAMSDGELHDEERRLILDYSIGRLRRLPSPPDDPELLARRWVGNQVPTRAAALAALGRVTANADDGRDLAHLMFDLIIADGAATDREMAAAEGIVRVLDGRERFRPGEIT